MFGYGNGKSVRLLKKGQESKYKQQGMLGEGRRPAAWSGGEGCGEQAVAILHRKRAHYYSTHDL